jgi:pyruvate dehydrogenase E1 component
LSHIESLLRDLPRNCTLITVIDGHPATLSWLGGVCGHQTISHGVEHFGQTGSISELYRHFHIDAEALVGSASELSQGRKIPYIQSVG